MPPMADPTNAPAAHGAVVTAECQGVKPRPFCRNTLKIITRPPSEPVNTTENTTPARYGRCRKTDGSTSGSRPARCRRTWYQPNPASASTAPAIIANSQAGQPSECPCASGKTSPNMATPASSAPGRSSRPRLVPPAPEPVLEPVLAPALEPVLAPALAAFGRVRKPSTSAASPTGTFTAKMARHPLPSTSRLIRPPDAIGPSIADRPITG